MANKYSQILLHIVFSVGRTHILIPDASRESVEKYITGTITKLNHRPLAIYCNTDHIHILVGYNPDKSVSDLVRDVKSTSTKFINKSGLTKGHFSWQSGYGAFSCGQRDLPKVVSYVLSQEEHHRSCDYKQEFIRLLKHYQIVYRQEYLFDF